MEKNILTRNAIDLVFSRKPNKRPFHDMERAKEICEMRLNGYTYAQIAKHYDISKNRPRDIVGKVMRIYRAELSKRDLNLITIPEKTCKDCFSKDVCFEYKCDYDDGCNCFKDKRKMADLPVEIGGAVYTIERKKVRKWDVVGVWLSADPTANYMHISWYKSKDHFKSMAVRFSDIGNIVFLTEEETEQRLKELESNARK